MTDMDARIKKYKAILFDMDGTVLDTLTDLTAAVNYAMAQTGHRCGYTREDTRYFFGSGARTAIRRALAREAGAALADLLLIGSADEQEESERILTVFKPYYEAHCREATAPYPGIEALLQTLRGAGLYTAVVSNKPDPAVQILAAAHFPGLFDFAAGERAGIPRKPAPDTVWQVLREMDVQPQEALYVGDSEIDIQTAAQAGMVCAAVTWGFRDRESLESLQPDFMADTAEELLEICLSGAVM